MPDELFIMAAAALVFLGPILFILRPLPRARRERCALGLCRRAGEYRVLDGSGEEMLGGALFCEKHAWDVAMKVGGKVEDK